MTDRDRIADLEARLSAHEETIRNQRAHAQKLEERVKQVDSLFSRNCKLSEEKRDLEARLAMVTEALQAALLFHIPQTQTIIHLQPEGKETTEVVRHGRRVKAEKALEATDADVQAFLARVKRQGAAEEVERLWKVSQVAGIQSSFLEARMYTLRDERAAELEREA